jgi:hypothetical protein
MTCATPIGADLARSLVIGLGADCPTAAALARVMVGRQGNAIDVYNLADWPPAAIHRVTTDFVARGWLSRVDTGWLLDRAKSRWALHPSSTAQPRCARSCRTMGWRRPS